VPENVAIDAAVTWAGAAGCLFYLWTMHRQGRHGVGAQQFLMGVLAGLLLVRGFDWITHRQILDRLTFAIASGLPLAITLFVEHVLRRHHPLWVKVFALASSVVFFAASLFTASTSQRPWMLTFAGCLALVVLVNGAQLLRRRKEELGAGENRLANLLALLTALTAVLVPSDFRTLTGIGSVRLGAIAALLFIYSMLGAALRSASAIVWAARFVSLLALAAVLSALVALATESRSIVEWWSAGVHIWPVAYAWILLTGIVVYSRQLSVESETNDFIRWLAEVPLGSRRTFLAALGSAPDAGTHVLLGREDLVDYSAAALARLPSIQGGIVSLAAARMIRRDGDDALTESADQWIDLLERTQMTHGFLARRDTPSVFVVNLPAATSSLEAEMRLRVMHHIGCQLELE
jgi:hypothetical protein